MERNSKGQLKDVIKQEYVKCAADPIYFLKKYCMIQHPIKGKIPFYPDQTHIHHRLLAKGLDQKQTVKLIWSLSIFISTTAIVLNNTLSNIYIFFSLILCLLLNLNIRKILKVIFKVY